MRIQEFISRYAYSTTEDNALEGLVNRDSIVLSLVKMDVEDYEADISDQKIVIFFCGEEKITSKIIYRYCKQMCAEENNKFQRSIIIGRNPITPRIK